MKLNTILCPLILTVLGSTSLATDYAAEIKTLTADDIANFLNSLSKREQQELASKLYYLDPKAEKFETKKTLLDELTKQGRVRKDDVFSIGPRTISTESSF